MQYTGDCALHNSCTPAGINIHPTSVNWVLGQLPPRDWAQYALYEPAHGRTRCRRPHINYISYIQKITGILL